MTFLFAEICLVNSFAGVRRTAARLPRNIQDTQAATTKYRQQTPYQARQTKQIMRVEEARSMVLAPDMAADVTIGLAVTDKMTTGNEMAGHASTYKGNTSYDMTRSQTRDGCSDERWDGIHFAHGTWKATARVDAVMPCTEARPVNTTSCHGFRLDQTHHDDCMHPLSTERSGRLTVMVESDIAECWDFKDVGYHDAPAYASRDARQPAPRLSKV